MSFTGESISQIGVGGIVALLIIDKVLSFLKTRSHNEHWKVEIHDLHKWMTNYAKLDSKVLEDVGKTMKTQVTLLQEMIFEMRETRKDVEQLKQNERK